MKRICFLFITVIVILTLGFTGSVFGRGTTQYCEEIEPYVSFLRKQSQNPVDYVMSLFQKYDIVILCERYHGEVTQYDMIYNIIRDERFVNKVGNVFTEVGSSSMNDHLHDFLFADGLTNNEVNTKALYIYRNLSWMPVWEKYNFFDFLKRLSGLNRSLPMERKINLYFTDMPFTWEGMTVEKYQQFNETLSQRDRVMAEQIIKRFNAILNSKQKRKKALVIMNYRHAFNDFSFADGKKADNVGRYVFEAFPGKVSNVMINSLALLIRSTDQKKNISVPIHDGKWDAAFEVLDNPNIGFDFADSPFGADYFDYYVFRKHSLSYQDVFTGFIFYEPLKKHKQIFGIPDLFGDGYDQIIMKRIAIYGQPVDENRKQEFIKQLEELQEYDYNNLNEIAERINQWLLGSEYN